QSRSFAVQRELAEHRLQSLLNHPLHAVLDAGDDTILVARVEGFGQVAPRAYLPFDLAGHLFGVEGGAGPPEGDGADLEGVQSPLGTVFLFEPCEVVDDSGVPHLQVEADRRLAVPRSLVPNAVSSRMRHE